MATVYTESIDELEPWIRAELEYDGGVSRGDQGRQVRRTQEWLTLHGRSVVVDGDFGPATERALEAFQAATGLDPNGKVDPDTWRRLVRPMRRRVKRSVRRSTPFGEAAMTYALSHLKVHPREVGGQNRGPWVRLYMQGNEGTVFPWCAGFVSFLYRQAADSVGGRPPIPGSFGCDELAAQAKRADLFMPEAAARPRRIKPGSLFLVRNTPSDFTHTGLVVGAGPEVFHTIEGNTNDSGDREGFEVCRRTRGYAGRDFIRV